MGPDKPPLPSPLRAIVGLAASVAEEARHLPERAVELPMIAVSTALQVSLRAQQRYAELIARGDEVLGGPVTDEPPAWATFDDPIGDDPIGDDPIDLAIEADLGESDYVEPIALDERPAESDLVPPTPKKAAKKPAKKAAAARRKPPGEPRPGRTSAFDTVDLVDGSVDPLDQ